MNSTYRPSMLTTVQRDALREIVLGYFGGAPCRCNSHGERILGGSSRYDTILNSTRSALLRARVAEVRLPALYQADPALAPAGDLVGGTHDILAPTPLGLAAVIFAGGVRDASWWEDNEVVSAFWRSAARLCNAEAFRPSAGAFARGLLRLANAREEERTAAATATVAWNEIRSDVTPTAVALDRETKVAALAKAARDLLAARVRSSAAAEYVRTVREADDAEFAQGITLTQADVLYAWLRASFPAFTEVLDELKYPSGFIRPEGV